MRQPADREHDQREGDEGEEVPRQRLRPEDRRALIVAAAAAEFGRHGHRGARLADIAAAAGTTKAVIYDHFASKEELHAEVISRASDELVEAVGTAVLEAPDDARERFEAGLLRGFEMIAERADVRTLLLGEPGTGDAVAGASRAAQRRARSAMAALYLTDETFLAGEPDRQARAEQIAQGGIGLVNGLAALGVEQRLSPDALTAIAMTMLWPGIDALRVPS